LTISDGFGPAVRLISPLNGSERADTNISLIYYASASLGGNLNCSLIVDGSNVSSFNIPTGRNWTYFPAEYTAR